MHSRRARVIATTLIAIVVFGLILTISRGERSRDLVLKIEPVDSSDEVTVYVGGAVEEAGLVALPRGSRLAEALDAAGLLEDADTSGLQMASVLRDEQSINVPRQSTATSEASLTPATGGSPLLDINQATETELQELPGIGPVIAARIRDRRNTVGPFESLQQLSEISGISDRMVDELRDYAIIGS